MSILEEFRSCWLIASIGCIFYFVGTGVLFWNEGRALHSILSLDEALEEAIIVNPVNEIDGQNDGHIVYFNGPIIIGEPLTEPEYNIQVLSVKLKRRVQMYQWVEETVEQNYGSSINTIESDNRNYYYTMEWRDKLIDSRNFYLSGSHRNPDHFPIESQTQIADNVQIGRIELGNEIKTRITDFVEVTSDTRPEDPSIKIHLGLYYHTNDVFNPEIGDVRILFSYAGLEGDVYSIVGKMENNKIVPFVTSRNSKVLLVYRGELSIGEMFKKEHHAQRLTTWTYRSIGWFLLFFATTFTGSLIQVILSRIYFPPFFTRGRRHPLPTNFALSFSLAFLITSIAWVFHRPWVGAGLLFAAASPFLYCARSVIQYQI